METPQDPGTPPPASPQPPPPPAGPTREQILSKVKPPAIALIVTAGIGIFFALLGLIGNLTGMTLGTAAAGDEAEMLGNFVGGGAGVAVNLISLAVGAFIIFSAIKMMQLQMWPIALAASIVAMVPCISPCCLLGLPFGIWALIILVDKDVKAAFQ